MKGINATVTAKEGVPGLHAKDDATRRRCFENCYLLKSKLIRNISSARGVNL